MTKERPQLEQENKPMSAKDRLNARMREEFLLEKAKREQEAAQQPCKKE